MKLSGLQLAAYTSVLLSIPVFLSGLSHFSTQTGVDLFVGFYPLLSGFVWWVLVYWYLGNFGWHVYWQQMVSELVFVSSAFAMLFYCHAVVVHYGYQVTL